MVLRLMESAPLGLVLQCGDAQPFRNESDLEYMNCPDKYRELGDFWWFFLGKEQFPVPMIFIGGNHEPWNYLDEHRDGGILVPNIEFLGRVGRREFNGLVVAGLSGVYSSKYFGKPHPAVPYPVSFRRQATYFNSQDINKASAFGRVDILLLHEWPSLMSTAEDKPWPSQWGQVGSDKLSFLVEFLKPRWVFCGHMHVLSRCKFEMTEMICLSDFARDTTNSFVVLDTITGQVMSS
jgi:hypothetical protein